MFRVSDIVQTEQSQRKMSTHATLTDPNIYFMSEIKNPIQEFYFWNSTSSHSTEEIPFMVIEILVVIPAEPH